MNYELRIMIGVGAVDLSGVTDVASGQEYDFVVLLRDSIQQIDDVAVGEVFG